ILRRDFGGHVCNVLVRLQLTRYKRATPQRSHPRRDVNNKFRLGEDLIREFRRPSARMSYEFIDARLQRKAPRNKGAKNPRSHWDHTIRSKSSTLFLGVTITPSARSRAICRRPTAPNFIVLITPCAATTRNQGIVSDSSAVNRAKTKATCRAVMRRRR